jgi:hypothetical protein
VSEDVRCARSRLAIRALDDALRPGDVHQRARRDRADELPEIVASYAPAERLDRLGCALQRQRPVAAR